MTRTLWAVALFCGACFAQGAPLALPPVTTTALIGATTVTVPVPGASVTICTSAGSGVPCSPKATVYADQALGTPTANPLTANAQGELPLVWLAPGTYDYSITGAGVTSTQGTTAAPIACVAGTACTIGPITLTGTTTNAGTITGGAVNPATVTASASIAIRNSNNQWSIDTATCCTGFTYLNTGLHLESSIVTDGGFFGNKNGDGLVLWNGDFAQPLNHRGTVQAGDTTSGNPKWNADNVYTLPDLAEGGGTGQSGYLLGISGPNMNAGHCMYQAGGPTAAGAGDVEDSGFGCNTNLAFPAATQTVGWTTGSFTLTLKPASVGSNEVITLPDSGSTQLAGTQITNNWTAQQNLSAGMALTKNNATWLTDGATLGELDIGTTAGGSGGSLVAGTVNATVALKQNSQAVALSGVNGISAGTVTLATGAGSHTFGTAYSVAPVCTATDQTTAAAVKATSSTTAVTLAGTGTDVVAWTCSPAIN